MIAEKCLAWAAVLLLILFLSFTLLGTLGVHAVISVELHQKAATDDGVIDQQIEKICQEIDLLAEEYGFSPENIKKLIQKDDLKELNSQTAAWWTRTVTDGMLTEEPRWSCEDLEETVRSALQGNAIGKEMTEECEAITDMIEKTVQTAILPVRKILLTTGMNYANKRINLQEFFMIARKMPFLGSVLCLVATGLIALFLGKDIRKSLKYFGTAAAGTGIVLIAAGILIRILNPDEMIRNAAEGLAFEYEIMMRSIRTEMGILAIGLLTGGLMCLFLYRRSEKGQLKAENCV